MMYFGGSSSIRLKNGTSLRFELDGGIRQGCSTLPYLYILCTKLLSTHVQKSTLKGICFSYRAIIISQLADDITFSLKNASQVPISIKTTQCFSAASGLCLNLKKCELFPFKECTMACICNSPVKEGVTYLGITIVRNEETRCSKNFALIIDKMEKKLSQWLQRDLSLKEQIFLAKAEVLLHLTSRIYPLVY